MYLVLYKLLQRSDLVLEKEVIKECMKQFSTYCGLSEVSFISFEPDLHLIMEQMILDYVLTHN